MGTKMARWHRMCVRIGCMTILCTLSLFPFIGVSASISMTRSIASTLIQEGKLQEPCVDTPVEEAIRKGVDWLLRRQLPDGAWAGSLYYISHVAIPVQSLLGSPYRDRTDVQSAAERGVRKIISEWNATLEQRKSDYLSTVGSALASDCSFSITCLLAAKSLAAFQNSTDQNAIDLLINTLILALSEVQETDGKWLPNGRVPVPDPAWHILVGEILQALADARGAGFTVPQVVIDKAVEWMKKEADPSSAAGAYNYTGSPICRRVVGELGMVRAGAARTTQLQDAVTLFFNEMSLLEQLRISKAVETYDIYGIDGRPGLSPEENMPGYFNTTKAIQVLGDSWKRQYFSLLEKTFIGNQEIDGRWGCGLFFWDNAGRLAYNTARSLDVLSRSLNAINTTDLTFTEFKTAIYATTNEIAITNTVKNRAPQSSAGSFLVGFYLSSDEILDASDMLLGSRTISGLAPFASSREVTKFPAPTASRAYWIIGKIDTANSVVEYSKDNNIVKVSSQSDLIIHCLTGDLVVVPGGSLKLNYVVKNRGLTSTGIFTTTCYLSKDTAVDSLDVLLDSSIRSLFIDDESAYSKTLLIPPDTSLGEYHIIVKADTNNQVAESTETNNTMSYALRVVNRPDLAITSFSVLPKTVLPGSTITITESVRSIGSNMSLASNVVYYLSTNQILDIVGQSMPYGDLLLASRSVSSLEVGLTSSYSTQVTIPSTIAEGNYYIIAYIDYPTNYSVYEGNEFNNIAVLPIRVGNPQTIDIMVVYTPAARAGAGGTSAMQALIDLHVDYANFAFLNSQVNHRFRLVQTAEVNYTEPNSGDFVGDLTTNLNRLTSKTDGYLDEVHTLRDQYGADLVSLYINGSSGIGWLINPNTAVNAADYGFSVVGYSSQGKNLVHEMGHNMGCDHDRPWAVGERFPYGYGYSFTGKSGQSYGTIMSYSGYTKIQHFSNPNVYYDGQATGIDYSVDAANSADNARVLNESSLAVSNYMATKVAPNSPPNIPSVPSGPTTGIAGTSYTYSTSTTDANGDSLRYVFEWGDGETTTTDYFASGVTVSASHTWVSGGTFIVRIYARDAWGATSNFSNPLSVAIQGPNSPPGKPSIPSGLSVGLIGTSYSYSTRAFDPNGDNVRYIFDWGDGTTSTTVFVASGATGSASHIWSSAATYAVKVFAEDVNGAISVWSDPLSVKINAVNTRPNKPSKPVGRDLSRKLCLKRIRIT